MPSGFLQTAGTHSSHKEVQVERSKRCNLKKVQVENCKLHRGMLDLEYDSYVAAVKRLCYPADSPMALVSSPLALRMENLNLARTSAFGQLTSSR